MNSYLMFKSIEIFSHFLKIRMVFLNKLHIFSGIRPHKKSFRFCGDVVSRPEFTSIIAKYEILLYLQCVTLTVCLSVYRMQMFDRFYALARHAPPQ